MGGWGVLSQSPLPAPVAQFVAANEAAHCRFMKMITLPKVRDTLRDGAPEIRVAPELADRARVAIERMVAISPSP